jgi:hypothetical protein
MGNFQYIIDPPIPVLFVFCAALLLVIRKYLRRDHFYILIISTSFGKRSAIRIKISNMLITRMENYSISIQIILVDILTKIMRSLELLTQRDFAD